VYVIVYFCVLFSSAGVTETSYPPALHVPTCDLRVASQDVKGHLRLRSV
jgi:hypothetical protein